MTGPAGRVMPLGEVPLPGDHNISNVLAAVAVGLLFGIAPDAIRRALPASPASSTASRRSPSSAACAIVNDSQGTQPDAVIAALRSFAPPIVLIAGGRTKNVPLDELAREVARRAAAVVLIGETADEMAVALSAPPAPPGSSAQRRWRRRSTRPARWPPNSRAPIQGRRRPCCSARRRRASTCSPTTPRADGLSSRR